MFTQNLQRTTLANGLTILVKPVLTAPVASIWLWYRVGSRLEVPGITGASHWVEHMLFKGTEAFPPGEADRQVARVGGVRNAMTWIDFTTYYQTVPAEHFELALQIEADRLVNSRFDPTEVDNERTVIISERQGAENEPLFLLDEEIRAAAFKVHGYHHGTIGWQCDLEQMTRDDLFNHYRQHYTPRNAVVVAVGPFEGPEVIEKITAYFGQIEAGPVLPPERSVEPPQAGERRVIRRGPSDTVYLAAAYHVPAANHPDHFPLVVMDTILGGASAMGMFADAEPSRSSRLYRALVETGLAADVGTQLAPTVAPFLYTLSVTVQAPAEPEVVEAALLAEVQRMVDAPVSEAEVAKAIKQTQAEFVYGAESVTDQAYWLGFSEIVASQSWLDFYLERLAAVTPEDVQRVAATYLQVDQRTIGIFLPEELS
jgi:zinc protease